MNRMSFLPAVLAGALSLGISTGAFALNGGGDFEPLLIGIEQILNSANTLEQTQKPQVDVIEAQINLIQQPAVKNALQAQLSAAKASIQKDVNSIKTSVQSLKATVNQMQSIQESLKKAAVLQAAQKRTPNM